MMTAICIVDVIGSARLDYCASHVRETSLWNPD